MHRLLKLVGLVAPLVIAGAASAEELDVAQNVITVATPNWYAGAGPVWNASPVPTARCLVWANAEGFGVGPAQLDGNHGVNMYIEPKPLASEQAQPTSFEAGIASLKAQYPTTPAWLVNTLTKNKAAIVKACSTQHDKPVKIYTITAKDAH